MEDKLALKKNKDVSRASDDDLRPWVQDPSFDAKIDEKISELNVILSITAPQKKVGARGESVLDRMPDSMIAFAELVENEDWMNQEGITISDEKDQYEDEDNCPESVPLEEDPDVVELAQYLNERNQEFEDATNDEKVMIRPITKREHEYMKQRMLSLAKHRKLKTKRIKAAAYLPSLHSRIYKEWAETQAAMHRHSSVFARDQEVPERPSTAFITSFLEQQGVLPSQTSLLLPLNTRPSTSSGRLGVNTDPLTVGTSDDRNYDILTLDHDSIRSPIRPLAPISEGRCSRPITSNVATRNQPFTSAGDSQASFDSDRPLPGCQSAPTLPVRPLTSYRDTIRPDTSQSRPSTSSSRRPPTRSRASLGDPPPVVFPASNTDTIPSANSSIVKYKSSRDYMLDTLNLPSKEQRVKARNRAVERARVAALVTDDVSVQSGRSQNSSRGDVSNSRFETISLQSPLLKIGITSNAGTVSNAASSDVYRRARAKEVRTLRDQMLTTSGAFQLHASDQVVLKGMEDYQAYQRATKEAALYTKATCEEDHTKDLVKLNGFFETVGAENIYLSETHKFYKEDDKLKEAIKKREKAHVTKADHVREWANSALTDGRKLFCNNGGGFCV